MGGHTDPIAVLGDSLLWNKEAQKNLMKKIIRR